MRPLELEMTAFGSYGETTVLPFRELKHALYLVTGDTGAGKTTIFDAIMFALYGVASGPDRKGDMLHCDHVSRSVDTRVRLRFSQNGKEYEAERWLHFPRVQGKKDAYRPGTVGARLLEPDRAPTEGAEKVSRRCEELLGLNAEQFRRIIMLAQGEFRKFLKADSDEKNEILGKLFDNSDCVYYQELLLGARNELKKRRAAGEEELRNLMQTLFRRPPELPEEEGEAFLPGHPALTENLEKLCAEEEAALDEREQARDALLEELHALTGRMGAAETVNKLLDALEKDEGQLRALEEQDAAMARRREAYTRAEAALHRALPAVLRREKAEEVLRRTGQEIEALAGELETLGKALWEAEEAASRDDDRRTEQAALLGRLRAMDEQLPRYGELRQKTRAKEETLRRLEETSAAREEEKKRLAALEGELAKLREALSSLGGVEAEIALHREETKQAQQRLEALCGKQGLQAEVDDLLRREEALKADKADLLRLTEAARHASRRYDAVYQHFLAEQAASLAGELRRTLEETGEGECPVCGTKLERWALPRLAVHSGEAPTKEAVEKEKQAASIAEAKRSEADARLGSLEAALLERQRAALEKAQTLRVPCTGWEELRGEEALRASGEEARRRFAEAGEALKAGEEALEKRNELLERLPELEKAREKLQQRQEALGAELQTLQVRAEAAEGELRALRGQLPFPTEEEAKKERQRLAGEAEAIDRLLREHQDRLEEARAKRDTARGKQNEKCDSLEKLGEERENAASEQTRVLFLCGFADAGEVREALAPTEGRDGEAWLREEAQALSEHEIRKNALREQIGQQRSRTAGKTRTDLSALEEQKTLLSQEHRAAGEACAALDSLLQSHRRVLREVRRVKADLGATEQAWRRLEPLANLAGGESGDGGKLSFDRYVMGTMFREILEMANRRLELMSGGRYLLVHKLASERKNAKAGLEIQVLDNDTGLLRPSGTLSGGEGFFTSLALALGLSDAVQNHAGGRQMDALFIDEGFGSLSDDALDKALEVLRGLTEGNRLVGIISHVDKLDESIPQKIRVRHGEKGSTLRLELG